jgi:hypothetical protein
MEDDAPRVLKYYQTFGDTKSRQTHQKYSFHAAQWATAARLPPRKKPVIRITPANLADKADSVVHASLVIQKHSSHHRVGNQRNARIIGFGL